jgi:hypothetical protein
LISEILATEAEAREIRTSSDRLLSDDNVIKMLSPEMIERAKYNFGVFALQCDDAARKLRALARQLGIESPDPLN